jgi:histidyl-tRNA synthetase
MKIPPVKGTRDFYPQDMAVRNWIIDGWKKVSLRNGFEEYDGPIFEYLKMYQIKSGDEIVEQLFSLKDRGDRDLALRPEITPTLARMVNQQISSLPRPIKWFSVPRLFRAERPQKGRLREFFQWNIDIIGADDVLADAEVIFATVDYLREVGLTHNDIKVKISSRKLLAAVLNKMGVSEEKLNPLYTLLDKKAKLPLETFLALLTEQVGDKLAREIAKFMELKTVGEVEKFIGTQSEEALNELSECLHRLRQMDIYEYCMFDPSIVRGLAYYTGVVFEVHDIEGDLRAIGGGGRYDNLLSDFGGQQVPATGMGMGDCVLEILLRQKSLLSEKLSTKQLDYFVIPIGLVVFKDPLIATPEDAAVQITASLRKLDFKAEFPYKDQSLGKQLKEAVERNAKYCIIIGDEYTNNQFVVKDMSTRKQTLVDVDKFFAELKP